MIDPKTGKRRGYTTGDVAKLLGVSPRTASAWGDSGRIETYRMPEGRGSSKLQRRIFSPDSLLVFLRDNNMPVPPELIVNSGVMIVSEDTSLRNELISRQTHCRFHEAATCFDAGRLYESIGPSVIVVDAFNRRWAALELLRCLRADKRKPKLLAVTTEDDADTEAFGVEAFRRPFDVGLLVTKLDSLMGV